MAIPWDAFQVAIASGADFMALTEHDSTANAYGRWTMGEQQWQDPKVAAAYFTSSGFVAMPAYECWLVTDNGERLQRPRPPAEVDVPGPRPAADVQGRPHAEAHRRRRGACHLLGVRALPTTAHYFWVRVSTASEDSNHAPGA